MGICVCGHPSRDHIEKMDPGGNTVSCSANISLPANDHVLVACRCKFFLEDDFCRCGHLHSQHWAPDIRKGTSYQCAQWGCKCQAFTKDVLDDSDVRFSLIEWT